MKATLFEFRNRRWIIISIFLAGFEFAWLDHRQVGGQIAQWLALHFGQFSLLAWMRSVFIFATVLLVISAWLRTWGTSYLQTAVMQSRTVHADRLLADGPFRHVRNPLYLGNMFMAVGVGLAMSPAGFVFLLVAMILFHYRLILREEADLLAAQGERYRAYCAAVPRLWFSILPRVPATGTQPHWWNGIIGELFHWAIAAGAILYAATFSSKIYWGIFILSILPGTLYRFHEARQRRRAQA